MNHPKPGEKILDHKWLDPICIDAGCQSLVLKNENDQRYAAQVELADLLASSKASNKELIAALVAIKNGLADTGSTIDQRMTLMTKADAWLTAHNAILRASGRGSG